MAKTIITKIKNNIGMVSKYLNNIYVLDEYFKDTDIEVLSELLNEIDSWKMCCEEIEMKIKSHHEFHPEEIPNPLDEKENELIIF
jgi:hypothetical protein